MLAEAQDYAAQWPTAAGVGLAARGQRLACVMASCARCVFRHLRATRCAGSRRPISKAATLSKDKHTALKTDDLGSTGQAANCAAMFGDASVERLDQADDFNEPLENYVTSAVFGETWTRPGPTLRERCLITVAISVALNRQILSKRWSSARSLTVPPRRISARHCYKRRCILVSPAAWRAGRSRLKR